MTIKHHNLLVLLTALVLSVSILLIGKKDKQPEIKSRVFHGAAGWGYEILVNGQLFIRQESIPVMVGSQGFQVKSQAAETAELIINKMKRNQLPTVTTFEVHKICGVNKIENGQSRKHQ